MQPSESSALGVQPSIVPTAAAPPAPRDVPSAARGEERILALDVLRGFALLGILYMNVQLFAMPKAAYLNPTAWGDLAGADLWAWRIIHVLVDQKFIALFTILFGAGILLFCDRLESRGVPPLRLHLRRTVWLLAIGLLHAYALWAGDILAVYAACAFLVYPLRKARPARLLAVGLVLLAVPTLMAIAAQATLPHWPADALDALRADWRPSAETLDAEVRAYRGSWLDQATQRVPAALELHSFLFFVHFGWRTVGLMLVGMALLKWGVLSGARPTRFYATMAAVGLALGIPLAVAGVVYHESTGWAVETSLFAGAQFNHWASVLVAGGYVGLVLLLCRLAAASRPVAALAAVGRMAFSAYLLQTLVATTVFYGHGLGLFGTLDRTTQVAFATLVLVAQVIFCVLWMRHHHFGPMEWVWRTLTYGRRQPLRRRAAATTRAADLDSPA